MPFWTADGTIVPLRPLLVFPKDFDDRMQFHLEICHQLMPFVLHCRMKKFLQKFIGDEFALFNGTITMF